MQKEIKKRAEEFIIKYNLNKYTLTVTWLRKIIESLNFGIVDYWHNMKNEPDVIALLTKTQTIDFYRFVNGFTYYNGEEKYVFLCGDLSADDTIDVLLHELGHIYLEHLEPEGLINNTNTQRERDAFLFSQYIQEKCRESGRIKLIRAASITAVAVALICVAALIFHYTITRKTITRDGQTIIQVGDTGMNAVLQPHCYWTAGGEVFHLWLDCQHISKSSTVYVGPSEKSGKNACCKTCYKKFCERYGGEGE